MAGIHDLTPAPPAPPAPPRPKPPPEDRIVAMLAAAKQARQLAENEAGEAVRILKSKEAVLHAVRNVVHDLEKAAKP